MVLIFFPIFVAACVEFEWRSIPTIRVAQSVFFRKSNSNCFGYRESQASVVHRAYRFFTSSVTGQAAELTSGNCTRKNSFNCCFSNVRPHLFPLRCWRCRGHDSWLSAVVSQQRFRSQFLQGRFGGCGSLPTLYGQQAIDLPRAQNPDKFAKPVSTLPTELRKQKHRHSSFQMNLIPG